MFTALTGWLLLLVLVRAWVRRTGRSPAWVVAAAWLGVWPYDAWVRGHCSGDCAIRVDLLLLGPMLLAVSAWGLWAAWRHRG